MKGATASAEHARARWELILPQREQMLAIARRRCESEKDAEDCVQEAMLRVAQFEGLDPARVGAMLTSVTVRLAVDLLRGRARAGRHLPRLASVPAQQPTPDEALLDRDEARWLAEQTQNLPDREREALLQRAAGFSTGKAAARLSVSYKAVESALARARGRMRVWAGVSALLIAEYLRRPRQRPAAFWAAVAVASAGCLVLSSLPPRVAESGEGSGLPSPRRRPCGSAARRLPHARRWAACLGSRRPRRFRGPRGGRRQARRRRRPAGRPIRRSTGPRSAAPALG